MPMPQSCGAGCDGQLRYGGSSRPSNILSPGFGYNRSRMHYIRNGGGSAAAIGGELSRSTSTRGAPYGGCGAFSASMAQLASSANQCNSRPKPLHGGGSGGNMGNSSSHHRLWSLGSSSHYCSSPFHGPYVVNGIGGNTLSSTGGGFPRNISSHQFYGACGFPGAGGFGGGGGAAAAASAGGLLHCGSSALLPSIGGSFRRGSCCSNVLPPQSHSHQIAKQLEQQQLELEEAAAGAGGSSYQSQVHCQYHDCGKNHHGGNESSYAHLIPEKLHDLVEVIKHPRSHGTQATRIAVSSLHIGECPGVPENASSFAMKRTGTLKWQPGPGVEEDDDNNSVSSDNSSRNAGNIHSSNGHENSSNAHNGVGIASRNSSRSSSRASNCKNNNGGATGGSSGLGLPRKVQYFLSSHEPKNETTSAVSGVTCLTQSMIAEVGGKFTTAGSSGSGGMGITPCITTQAAPALLYPPAFATETEKVQRNRSEQDTSFTAAVALPRGTKAATRGLEGSDEEVHQEDACETGVGANESNAEKEGDLKKRKKTLGFTKKASAAYVRRPAGIAHAQRYQQNIIEVDDNRWTATSATGSPGDIGGDGGTTAAGSGNSSGGSGGESDHSCPTSIVSPPSYGSALSALSGKESDCSGSPRRHHAESTVEDAAQLDTCPPLSSGGSELRRNFSWHKLRQKLKL